MCLLRQTARTPAAISFDNPPWESYRGYNVYSFAFVSLCLSAPARRMWGIRRYLSLRGFGGWYPARSIVLTRCVDWTRPRWA